jgi:cobalamin biosynthesis protein CobD/CbiB
MAVAIGLGAVLDAIMGDPARYHPVAGFGRFAAMLERGMWRPQRRHGVVYVGRRAPVLVGRDPSVLDSDQLVRAVAQLAERGIAVRPASSFPGLGPGHLRVAVRADRDNARLVAALAEIDA